jgi:hypothetical protein
MEDIAKIEETSRSLRSASSKSRLPPHLTGSLFLVFSHVQTAPLSLEVLGQESVAERGDVGQEPWERVSREAGESLDGL